MFILLAVCLLHIKNCFLQGSFKISYFKIQLFQDYIKNVSLFVTFSKNNLSYGHDY